jgi:hypothetical protein
MGLLENWKSSLGLAWNNPSLLVVLGLEFVFASVVGLLFFLLDMWMIVTLNPLAKAAATPRQFISLVTNPATYAVLGTLVLVQALLLGLIDAYFKGGFFSMARNTIQDGGTSMREFLSGAKRYVWPMLGLTIVRYGILIVCGLPLLVAGISILGSSPSLVDARQWALLGVALAAMLVAWLATFVLFLYAEAAIVFDGEGGMAAIRVSVRNVVAAPGRSLLLAGLVLLTIVAASVLEWLLGMPMALLARYQPSLQLASDAWGFVLNAISLFAATVVALLIFSAYASARKHARPAGAHERVKKRAGR